MKLDDLLDVRELGKLIGERYISQQPHPTLPLFVLNYTHKATFDKIWNPITRLCRGLQYDVKGTVVARPYYKFFNFNDETQPETLENNLPSVTPEVTEKLDGSMIVYTHYASQHVLATRGSFTSDQAQWAQNWYVRNLVNAVWPKNYTPVFEVITDENRIVVSYPYEALVLTGLVNIDTGAEMRYIDLKQIAKQNGCPVVNVSQKSLFEAVKDNQNNFEGYVLTYHLSDCTPLKLKIKTKEYCRLHRILTGLNPRAIWEMLAEKQDTAVDSIMKDPKMPAKFLEWFGGWVEQLRFRFAEIEKKAMTVFVGRAFQGAHTQGNLSPEALRLIRKKHAEYFQKTPELCSILFAMLDGKNYGEIIWKIIKPRGDETFKKDGE